VVSEGLVTGYASEQSSWRRQQGQSVAGGGGARGGAHGDSGGEDLVAEARWGTESAAYSASSEAGVGGLQRGSWPRQQWGSSCAADKD
jgi:hypothetical protein